MANVETKVIPQRTQELERFHQLIRIQQRRQVGEHPHDFYATGVLQRLEAFDLSCRGLSQPAIEYKRGFHGPAKGAVTVPVGVFVDQMEGFIQKPSLQVEDNRLIVGIANIGVAMVDKVKSVNVAHGL